jgi:hypothetical protein
MDEQRAAARPVTLSRTVALAAAIGLYALAAAIARPLTDPATWTVLLPGFALAVYGLRRPPTRARRTNRRTTVTWIGLGLAFCAWEVVAFHWGNDQAHPTLSLLFDPALETYPARFAGYVAWLGTGAWLVSR